MSVKTKLLICAACTALMSVVLAIQSTSIKSLISPIPEQIIQTETLSVVRTGRRMSVEDLTADRAYHFALKHVRRSEGVVEPVRATETESIKIETLGNVLRITDKIGEKVYRVRFGRGGVQNESF